MICARCAHAADAHLGRDAHCHDDGCDCQHRVERYRTTTGQITDTTGEKRR